MGWSIKPEDRYASCRALAEDIERWMADEPVTAWREPWTQTMLRWLTRHRTGVTGAAAAGLAALVGLGAVTAVQARANAELTQSKAAVQARYNLAVDAIKTFHTGVSEDFLLKQDQFKELRDRLLNSAGDFYGKLGALLGKETDVTSRRALEQSNFELAELTRKVGRIEAALAAHRSTLAAREALAAETGATTGIKSDVGRSLTAVASLLYATGNVDEALAAYHRAESLLAGLAGSDPEARAALATCRTRMSRPLHHGGKSALALAACKQARADLEALATVPGASNVSRHDFADTLNELGIVLWQTGKPAEAEPEFRTAIAIQQKLADDNPGNTAFRVLLANSRVHLGNVLKLMGKVSDAEAEFRVAMAIYQKLADGNPEDNAFRDALAGSLNCLGAVVRSVGRLTEAKRGYEQAIALLEQQVQQNPTDPWHRYFLASSIRQRGLTLGDLGDPVGAAADARRALVLCDGPGPGSVEEVVEMACCHAALAGLAGRARSGVSAAEGEEEARASIEWLHRAVATGYRNGNELRIESALDPLRDRDDFRMMIMDLDFPAEPFSKVTDANH
jgi:eukaryotic-like serine/threonine-protein kinase